MPLSEHEQRMLDEMERNLYRNDADVVASVTQVRLRPNYRAIVIGVLLALVGFGAIIGSLAAHLVIVGVAGFAVVLTGVLVAMRPSTRDDSAPASAARSGVSRGRSTSGSFMDRMNDRWDRRAN
ncbi:MAG TPA: DUF3040 domain-containing protein [Microbacteriaceae bacterium]|nr:DUF3040 domain-containing protein [Microbacteriaceae bacterium]